MDQPFDFLVIGGAYVTTTLVGKTIGGVATPECILDEPGGNGFYFSAALASLGWSVLYFGSLGADPFGDYLSKELANAGVECEFFHDPRGTQRMLELQTPPLTVYSARSSFELEPTTERLEKAVQSSARVILSTENWARNAIPACQSAAKPLFVDLTNCDDLQNPYYSDFARAGTGVLCTKEDEYQVEAWSTAISNSNPSAYQLFELEASGCAYLKPGEELQSYQPQIERLGKPYPTGSSAFLSTGFLTARARGFDWEPAIIIGETFARHAAQQRRYKDKFLDWDQLKKLSGIQKW